MENSDIPVTAFRGCSFLALRFLGRSVWLPRKAGWGSGITSAPPLIPCVTTVTCETELVDQGTIALDVGLLEVVQQLTTLADELEQASAGVEVLLVGLEMVSETIDAGGEKSNLNFGGAGVAFVLGELSDNGLLLSGIHSHSGILLSDKLSEVIG